jgi:hypothetical protein
MSTDFVRARDVEGSCDDVRRSMRELEVVYGDVDAVMTSAGVGGEARGALRSSAQGLIELAEDEGDCSSTACVFGVEHTERAMEALIGCVRDGYDAVVPFAERALSATTEAETTWALARERGSERELEDVKSRETGRKERLAHAMAAMRDVLAFEEFLADERSRRRPGVEDAVNARDALAHRERRLLDNGGVITDVQALEMAVRDLESRQRMLALIGGVPRVAAYGRFRAASDDPGYDACVARCLPALIAQYVTWIKDAALEDAEERSRSIRDAALALSAFVGDELIEAENARGWTNILCALYNAIAVLVSVELPPDRTDTYEDLRRRATIRAAETTERIAARSTDTWNEDRFGVEAMNMALERLLSALDASDV